MYVNERFIAFHLAERCRLALWQMSEIAEVVRTVKSLATGRADGYRQSEIGVITPWREQVWRIRLKLREAGYHDINVGNVEVSNRPTLRTNLEC